MTGKQRIETVFNGGIPDRVPHFELLFQLEEEAFGMQFPRKEDFANASEAEKRRMLVKHLDIWERIVSRYNWDAIYLPYSLYGHLEGEVYAEGKKRFGDEVAIFDFNGDGTFWMMPGDETLEFVIKMYEEPERLKEQAFVMMNESIELARKQVKAGVDFICINSDYGYNTGPFISPDQFKEFVTPYLNEIVSRIHDFGIKAILHSDGDLRKILDQLVSTGIDGYQSVDPQGNMDIAKIKQEYGDNLILMGNVKASLLQDANENEIRESVRYCIQHGKPGGRYIFSTSNSIFKGMPLESYHIMLDEYRKIAEY